MILLLSISKHYDVMKSPQTFVIVIVQNVRIAGKVTTQIYIVHAQKYWSQWCLMLHWRTPGEPLVWRSCGTAETDVKSNIN